MNDFDQGSHLATLLERSFVLARVNELAQLNATFRTWFTTKTASLGDDPDRIADLLEGRNVTESILGKQMRQQGEEIGERRNARRTLLFLIDKKFGSQIPEDYLRLIREQESLALLDGWFHAAVTADTAEAFLAHLRQ